MTYLEIHDVLVQQIQVQVDVIKALQPYEPWLRIVLKQHDQVVDLRRNLGKILASKACKV